MIQLSDRFHYKKLLRFTFPSIVVLVFTSIYGVVDGLFVSNFAGKTSFAAVNFIIPFLMILGGLGFMFGTGGSALIAKTIGEGDTVKANRIFSLIVYVSIGLSVVLAGLGFIHIRPIASALGAEGQLLEESVTYGRVVLSALPALFIRFEFESLFAAAEKPKIGLYVTIAAGLTNIVLDALFIVVFSWGLLRKSVDIIGVFSLVMFGVALLLAKPLSALFVGYDQALMVMTQRAFFIFSFSFLR